MSNELKEALRLIEKSHHQYFEDVEQYGVDRKKERKLRKVRDILRSMEGTPHDR